MPLDAEDKLVVFTTFDGFHDTIKWADSNRLKLAAYMIDSLMVAGVDHDGQDAGLCSFHQMEEAGAGSDGNLMGFGDVPAGGVIDRSF